MMALTGTPLYPACASTEITSDNIDKLVGKTLNAHTWVSWRPEGRRAMIFTHKNETHLVWKTSSPTSSPTSSNAQCAFTKIKMHFPRSYSASTGTVTWLENTLLDGVLVEDREQSAPDKVILRYAPYI